MKKKVIISIILMLMINIGCFTPTSSGVAQIQLTINQLYQHKDTIMPCTPGNNDTVHPWNHSRSFYGCSHCATYCAPAIIAMIADYRGKTSPTVDQDYIYDSGKYTGGEAPGDGTIQTHGAGMYHESNNGFEVQGAFAYAVDTAFYQYSINDSTSSQSWGGAGASVPTGQPANWSAATWQGALTPAQLVTLLGEGRPVLWLDHDGWPAENPSWEGRSYQGHAKVIAGHDDYMGTTGDYSDDLFYIYDPWPYTTENIPNPYNVPSSALFDFGGAPTRQTPQQWQNDVFLVDSTYASVVELPPNIFTIVFLSLSIFLATIIVLRYNRKD
ncbi:MAG: C39 family peptidase [Candidatus Hodarchaeota archaeon]